MSEADELRQQLQAMHRRAQKAEGLLKIVYSEHSFAKEYVERRTEFFDYHSRRTFYATYIMNNKIWRKIAVYHEEFQIKPLETPEQTLVKWILHWIARRLNK